MNGVTTGITITNPNGKSEERHIDVRLHATGQVVKAMPIFPLNLDVREQSPNIKTGTEVVMIYSGVDSFFIIGSSGQFNDQISSKQYKVENASAVKLLTDGLMLLSGVNGRISQTTVETDKIKIDNGSNELVSLISDICQACTEIQVLHDGAKPVTQDTVLAFQEIKSKVESFI